MRHPKTHDITLGILGGGQLGMMSAQAAKALGIKTVIYSPNNNSPAAMAADKTIVAPYDDLASLKAFAHSVDFISYEFENIPVETVRFLRTHTPVHPDDVLLRITQDRIAEKAYLNDIGIATAPWAEVTSPDMAHDVLSSWGASQCILKTTRMGYDGKGQVVVHSTQDIQNAWEGLVDFDCEISVIVARDTHGQTVSYEPSVNMHKNAILHQSTSPSGLNPQILQHARDISVKLADAVNLQGVLALELFVKKDGTLLANEIATRTHNSGHWTIEACAVSQFENHVRAVCNMPVLQPDQHSKAQMINLIGNDIKDLEQYKNQENVYIHDYGKTDIKPDRKMGHVTIVEKL